MSAQREAFEVWAATEAIETDAFGSSPPDYYSRPTRKAWRAWQAAQAAMQVNPDAARYRWLQRGTAGIRDGRGLRFDLRIPTPVGNIMQGSVSQHLDAAIDAEIARTGGAA